MAESLGNPEKAALLALLLAGGEVSTPDLRKHHGVDLRKDARDKLNDAGLVVSRIDNAPHHHRITAAGVTECENILAAGERPVRPSPLLVVLCELFVPVVAHWRQHGIRLADVLLESSIHRAYGELATEPQDWVRLAKLRPRLDGVDRDEVDRALRAMAKTGLVHLAPSSNRKGLTDDDHAAAIRVGVVDNHLVAIEES
jgi:hypothetical protein